MKRAYLCVMLLLQQDSFLWDFLVRSHEICLRLLAKLCMHLIFMASFLLQMHHLERRDWAGKDAADRSRQGGVRHCLRVRD